MFLLCSNIYFSITAQICGSDILRDHFIKTDSNFLKITAANQKTLAATMQKQKAASILGAYFGMQTTIYTIPVVIHVMHTGGAPGSQYNPSTTDLQDAMTYLNAVYAGTSPGNEGVGDIGIQFVLANRDPNNNPTTGIDRQDISYLPNYVNYGVALQGTNGLADDYLKSLVRWDPGLYYNIYVVNKIDGSDGACCGPFVAGYAFTPGVYVNQDGAVMLSKVMKNNNKTLPHEMGHALGLYHPFEGASGSTCPAAGPCGSTGDLLCDTDPVTQPPFVARTGINPCTSTPYNIYTEHNFMNYTDVFTLFTPDQKAMMLGWMSFPTRSSLAVSWAKAATYPYAFTSPLSACASASNAAGIGSFVSGLTAVNVDGRQFSSGITATDPGYVDKANSPLHLIPLNPSTTYSLTTDLFTYNYPQQVAAYIDYNNNGNFEAGERLLYADAVDAGGDVTRLTTTFTVPGAAVSNTVLRMRVINEVESYYGYLISSGCYAPRYGQTEDFPVFIAGVLPVNYKYFKGQKSNDNVLLQWGATVTHKGYFDVERAEDGVSFEAIGQVNASPELHEYTFPDPNALAPVYFYRLRQLDLNGESKYSSTILIRNEQQSDDQFVRVTNPFRNSVDIVFRSPLTITSRAELLDLNGRILLRSQIPAGQSVHRIDLAGKQMSSGVYMLKIQTGDVIITRKIVKQ